MGDVLRATLTPALSRKREREQYGHLTSVRGGEPYGRLSAARGEAHYGPLSTVPGGEGWGEGVAEGQADHSHHSVNI